jgi:hypothetical protein
MVAISGKSGHSRASRKGTTKSLAGSILSQTSPDVENAAGAALGQRHKAVIDASREIGLLAEKDSRISGRVSGKLVMAAREKTGITSDTELIELALASLALEDNFGKVLSQHWGLLDAEADFGT